MTYVNLYGRINMHSPESHSDNHHGHGFLEWCDSDVWSDYPITGLMDSLLHTLSLHMQRISHPINTRKVLQWAQSIIKVWRTTCKEPRWLRSKDHKYYCNSEYPFDTLVIFPYGILLVDHSSVYCISQMSTDTLAIVHTQMTVSSVILLNGAGIVCASLSG